MKKKTLWIIIGVLCAAAILYLAVRPTGKSSVTLETAKAERINITNSVTATGTVEPVTKVEVGTQVSGIIDKLYADYNDEVKAGQVIAVMDKINLEAELTSSQAQLDAAKTEYEYREKEYNRTKTLHDKELVSDSDYDSAYYQYATAKNAYSQAQASYVKVKRNLSYATITSPIDGVVISRAVEEGQTVAAGFETDLLDGSVEDVVRICVDGECYVLAFLDLADVGLVNVCNYLHISKILRDGEERRSLEACGYRLAFLHGAADDHSVDRGSDGRVTQVALNLDVGCLRLAVRVLRCCVLIVG